MIETNETTYLAVITLSLPSPAETATAHVLVKPSQVMETSDGQVRRLGDCTLADLQTYADALEAEVWQTYQAIRLEDLAAQTDIAVAIRLVNEPDLSFDLATLLDHVVLGVSLPPAAAPKDKDETAGEAAAVRTDAAAAQTDSEQAEAAPMPAVEPQTATAPETMAAPEAMAAAEAAAAAESVEAAPPAAETPPEEHEPSITVAESEPVHEEREARPGAPARPISPHIRILGKRRPLGHATWTAVDILMNEPAFRDAQAHALSSMDREVAGMLVGPPPEKQPDGRYLAHITDIIIARHTRMHGASVTYTPESWRYVNDRLLERYPEGDAVIVGWYHTHPGFGIFLSGMDQFIHQNFFTQIWHIALVLDPRAQRSGFFCWDRQKTRVDPYEFPWPAWARSSW